MKQSSEHSDQLNILSCVSCVAGEAQHFCGAAVSGFSMGTRSTAAFAPVRIAQRDPINPSGYYLADRISIRYFDTAKDVVTLIGGDTKESDLRDAFGESVRLDTIHSLLVTSDGQCLWCCEERGGLRSVYLSTKIVCSIRASWGKQFRSLVWDRSPHHAESPAFYCIVGTDNESIYRFDTRTEELSLCVVVEGMDDCVIPDLVATASGHLIFAVPKDERYAAYVRDPQTGAIEALGFEFDWCAGAVVMDSIHTLVTITTRDSNLVTHTLPPQYFPLPKCCDRD